MRVSMQLSQGDIVHMRSEKYRVNITPELRGRLDDLLGEGHYKLMMSKPSR
jgi:DNA polymerase-3 subunit alpha